MLRRLTLVTAALVLAACSSSEPQQPADQRSNGQNPEPPALGIRNLSAPMPNVLCSGQPTEAQFDQLEAAGVVHVLHLRKKGENGTGWEEQRAAKADVKFERLEIDGGKGLTRENVQAFADKLDSYGDEMVLVSCGSSNRVGAMFALKAAWLDGKSKDEAMALGKRAGMKSLTATVEKLLAE